MSVDGLPQADPEIPADIYEIGLIYRIDIADDRTVKVAMSLTSPNCPSAQELPVMVQDAVSTVPGVGKDRRPDGDSE
jgi:metal-sulfur cluster biosynthetic enzyme